MQGFTVIEAFDLSYPTDGSVIICEGSNEKCEKVASVLGSIGLVVTVTQ